MEYHIDDAAFLTKAADDLVRADYDTAFKEYSSAEEEPEAIAARNRMLAYRQELQRRGLWQEA